MRRKRASRPGRGRRAREPARDEPALSWGTVGGAGRLPGRHRHAACDGPPATTRAMVACPNLSKEESAMTHRKNLAFPALGLGLVLAAGVALAQDKPAA